MQLASHGERRVLAARQAASIIGRTAGAARSVRSIHMPSYARLKPPQLGTTTTKRLLNQTRTLFAQFLGHLTAPGIGTRPAPSLNHSLHGGLPGRLPGITQRLSPVARTQLARPLQGHFFPKVATAQTFSVANVGLGSARNFSTGRQVFQRLAENVPVTGRAFVEADWDVNTGGGRSMKASGKVSKKAGFGGEMLKPTPKKIVAPVLDQAIEFDHYFSTPASSGTTTYLLIPLSPTPTSRTPLPADGSLLHFPSIASIHQSHELHSLRVSSLFSRLDAAKVWEKGVLCSSYAQSSTIDGTCTILKVEFTGWTKAEVRSVLGESGSGWCILEEVQTTPDEFDDSLSDTSSVLSGMFEDGEDSRVHSPIHPEPAHAVTSSFVLPTLDLSSAFRPPSAPHEEVYDFHSETLSDFEDALSASDWSSEFSDIRAASSSAARSAGFISDFGYEPRESAFY